MGVCIDILLSINLSSGERAHAFPSKAHSNVWSECLVVMLVSGMGWHGFLPAELSEGHPYTLGWLCTTCTNGSIGSTHVQPTPLDTVRLLPSWDPNLCLGLITPDGV